MSDERDPKQPRQPYRLPRINPGQGDDIPREYEAEDELPAFMADRTRDTEPEVADDIADAPPAGDEGRQRTISYRASASDPAFGFLLAIALSIGLTPMLPSNADLRYTLAWGALAGVGVLAWLLGSSDRIGQEKPENVVWGVLFGLLLGGPFLLFGVDVLERASRLIFPQMTPGTLLAYLVFVMPLAETLFFRGVMQRTLEFYIVGALSGVWSILLFFPVMWGEVLAAPTVALIIALALITMNMLYSYVRERNGLAASWLCQIVTSVLMVFIPFL